MSHEREGWARVAGEGLEGASGAGLELELEPTLHFSDSLSLELGLGVQHLPDWLLWRGGNRLGSYRADLATLGASLQWQIGHRQELRVKLETIALDARLRQAWAVRADGEPIATATPADITDFSLANLGFQVRYRYELAPLSYLYVVSARGGYEQRTGTEGVEDLLQDSFRLRDDEQLVVKLSYRFEI